LKLSQKPTKGFLFGEMGRERQVQNALKSKTKDPEELTASSHPKPEQTRFPRV
jgi:hypothetical protein